MYQNPGWAYKEMLQFIFLTFILFPILWFIYVIFLAADEQLKKWLCQSVRPFVCPSVRLSHFFSFFFKESQHTLNLSLGHIMDIDNFLIQLSPQHSGLLTCLLLINIDISETSKENNFGIHAYHNIVYLLIKINILRQKSDNLSKPQPAQFQNQNS